MIPTEPLPLVLKAKLKLLKLPTILPEHDNPLGLAPLVAPTPHFSHRLTENKRAEMARRPARPEVTVVNDTSGASWCRQSRGLTPAGGFESKP
jgi:hypothetical protein